MAGAATTRIEARAAQLRRELESMELALEIVVTRDTRGRITRSFPSLVAVLMTATAALADMDRQRALLVPADGIWHAALKKERRKLEQRRLVLLGRVNKAQWNIHQLQRRYHPKVRAYESLGAQLQHLRAVRESQVNSLVMYAGKPFFKQGAYESHRLALTKRLAAWRDCQETGGENWASIYAAADAFCRKYPPGA